MTRLQILATVTLLALQTASSAAPSLDYSFFKDRVQPILLKKRPGHARCVTCHEHGSPPLPRLAPGATMWNDDESRKNFEIWKLFVVPGNPMKSPLLLHPLGIIHQLLLLPHQVRQLVKHAAQLLVALLGVARSGLEVP